jgi:hypothetical protein
MSDQANKECIFCQRDENQVPLVQLSYMAKSYWICPQHIPILIHDPAKLKGALPGAENLQPG